MIIKEIKVINRYGIHARPSSMISELANTFKSTIIIKKDNKTANAQSIMNLILLCVEPKSTIILQIDGEDEELAMQSFIDLIEVRRFDEDLN